jgi:hypothetical protein
VANNHVNVNNERATGHVPESDVRDPQIGEVGVAAINVAQNGENRSIFRQYESLRSSKPGDNFEVACLSLLRNTSNHFHGTAVHQGCTIKGKRTIVFDGRIGAAES